MNTYIGISCQLSQKYGSHVAKHSIYAEYSNNIEAFEICELFTIMKETEEFIAIL